MMSGEVYEIKDDNELQDALDRVKELFGASRGTPEGATLDLLVDAVEKYEASRDGAWTTLPASAVRWIELSIGTSGNPMGVIS